MYNVLIADDEALMREALGFIIASWEVFSSVYFAQNGEEALEICRREKIDLIFMDIVMPGMTGLECAAGINRILPAAHIYIISRYKSLNISPFLAADVRGYIQKPILTEDIENVLCKFLEESSVLTKDLLMANNLTELIDEKDFKKMYDSLPVLSEAIFSENEKDGNFVIALGQRVLSHVEGYNESLKLEELFPPDRHTKDLKKLSLWLFELLNFAFIKSASKRYHILESVFDFIDENIEKNLSLSDIVTSCNISQGHLSRIFKRMFCVSTVEYIHIRKIMLSKAYMAFTEMSIDDIAFNLGYADTSYFRKVFKKYENITVHQYKKL